MKKHIDFTYDEENGITIAELNTGGETFFGMSVKHPDDPLHPSFIIGTNIAEARANIKLINRKIEKKRLELKGLKRLKGSMPSDNPGYHYVENLYDAIFDEILMLKREKGEWQKFIDTEIKGRSLYVRSRTTSKEDKEKMRKSIEEGLKKLSDLNNEDKND